MKGITFVEGMKFNKHTTATAHMKDHAFLIEAQILKREATNAKFTSKFVARATSDPQSHKFNKDRDEWEYYLAPNQKITDTVTQHKALQTCLSTGHQASQGKDAKEAIGDKDTTSDSSSEGSRSDTSDTNGNGASTATAAAASSEPAEPAEPEAGVAPETGATTAIAETAALAAAATTATAAGEAVAPETSSAASSTSVVAQVARVRVEEIDPVLRVPHLMRRGSIR